MTPKPMTKNTLFYGDNLPIMREYIPDESIDLIYLDPPFNSNRSYNVLFKEESGLAAEAQISAFDDSWHWGPAAEALYLDIIRRNPGKVDDFLVSLRNVIGNNQMMAYLVMMAGRLVELQRVLKPTGSLYLHCDPTASHYLKVILDTVFGPEHFVNEIIWKRQTAHSDIGQGARHFGRLHDTILFYAKGDNYTWIPIYADYDPAYINSKYRYVEEGTGRRYRLGDITGPGGAAKGNPQYEFLGIVRYWRYSKERMDHLYKEGWIVQTKPGSVPQYKRYLDEMPGQPLQALWTDIDPINSMAVERLGYPTQKPFALLERNIQASSNPGDIVLDPFCGCGTAVAAAQKLGRRWIGIDITHLSISLIKYRMADMFPDCEFDVIGEPQDLDSARQLAQDDRYQFQWWALSLIRARPVGNEPGSKKGKKGSDQGIDGVINFMDDPSTPSHVMVQVKSGHVKSGDIRDLHGVIDREKSAIGLFITLEAPSAEMLKEAASVGYYHSNTWNQDYPKLQILTIEDLLKRKEIKMPPDYGTFKQAQKVKKTEGKQGELGI